ncbi:MAG: hypothetical protein ACON5A_03110 [Candidatus Comchoanobacterales bacterium]
MGPRTEQLYQVKSHVLKFLREFKKTSNGYISERSFLGAFHNMKHLFVAAMCLSCAFITSVGAFSFYLDKFGFYFAGIMMVTILFAYGCLYLKNTAKNIILDNRHSRQKDEAFKWFVKDFNMAAAHVKEQNKNEKVTLSELLSYVVPAFHHRQSVAILRDLKRSIIAHQQSLIHRTNLLGLPTSSWFFGSSFLWFAAALIANIPFLDCCSIMVKVGIFVVGVVLGAYYYYKEKSLISRHQCSVNPQLGHLCGTEIYRIKLNTLRMNQERFDFKDSLLKIAQIYIDKQKNVDDQVRAGFLDEIKDLAQRCSLLKDNPNDLEFVNQLNLPGIDGPYSEGDKCSQYSKEDVLVEIRQLMKAMIQPDFAKEILKTRLSDLFDAVFSPEDDAVLTREKVAQINNVLNERREKLTTPKKYIDAVNHILKYKPKPARLGLMLTPSRFDVPQDTTDDLRRKKLMLMRDIVHVCLNDTNVNDPRGDKGYIEQQILQAAIELGLLAGNNRDKLFFKDIRTKANEVSWKDLTDKPSSKKLVESIDWFWFEKNKIFSQESEIYNIFDHESLSIIADSQNNYSLNDLLLKYPSMSIKDSNLREYFINHYSSIQVNEYLVINAKYSRQERKKKKALKVLANFMNGMKNWRKKINQLSNKYADPYQPSLRGYLWGVLGALSNGITLIPLGYSGINLLLNQILGLNVMLNGNMAIWFFFSGFFASYMFTLKQVQRSFMDSHFQSNTTEYDQSRTKDWFNSFVIALLVSLASSILAFNSGYKLLGIESGFYQCVFVPFLSFLGYDAPILSHNAKFNIGFINAGITGYVAFCLYQHVLRVRMNEAKTQNHQSNEMLNQKKNNVTFTARCLQCVALLSSIAVSGMYICVLANVMHVSLMNPVFIVCSTILLSAMIYTNFENFFNGIKELMIDGIHEKFSFFTDGLKIKKPMMTHSDSIEKLMDQYARQSTSSGRRRAGTDDWRSSKRTKGALSVSKKESLDDTEVDVLKRIESLSQIKDNRLLVP